MKLDLSKQFAAPVAAAYRVPPILGVLRQRLEQHQQAGVVPRIDFAFVVQTWASYPQCVQRSR